MPWDIICLQEVFRDTDKLGCGANYVFFFVPKMLGALRAPATTANAVSGESKWVDIEVNINNLPHKRLPLEQFTATLEEVDTSLGKFPKHKGADGARRECEAGRKQRPSS